MQSDSFLHDAVLSLPAVTLLRVDGGVCRSSLKARQRSCPAWPPVRAIRTCQRADIAILFVAIDCSQRPALKRMHRLDIHSIKISPRFLWPSSVSTAANRRFRSTNHGW